MQGTQHKQFQLKRGKFHTYKQDYVLYRTAYEIRLLAGSKFFILQLCVPKGVRRGREVNLRALSCLTSRNHYAYAVVPNHSIRVLLQCPHPHLRNPLHTILHWSLVEVFVE